MSEIDENSTLDSKAAGPDYLSQLPPELLREIVSYLEGSAGLALLRVSRRLHDVVGGLHSYWKKSCIDGVTVLCEDDVRRPLEAGNFSGPREFFVAKQRHTTMAVGRPLKSGAVSRKYTGRSGNKDFINSDFKFVENGIVVEVIPSSNDPSTEAIVVVEFDCKTNSFRKIFSCPIPECHHVTTAYASPKHLLYATECGIWTGYDLHSKTKLYSFKGSELTEAVTTGCCDKCFLVVYPDLCIDTQHSKRQYYWSLEILKLGKKKQPTQQFNIRFPAEHIHDSLTPFALLVGEVYVIPSSEKTDNGGFCKSHEIIVQCGPVVAIYRLESPATLITQPLKIFCALCEDPERRMEDVHIFEYDFPSNGGIVISKDRTLLGMLYSSCLTVWNLQTYKEERCVDVDVWGPSTELLALGKIYSILGSDENRGKLQIIYTQTGEDANEISNFGKKQRSRGQRRQQQPFCRGPFGIPLPSMPMRKASIAFLGVLEESWVNNHHSICPSNKPFLLFRSIQSSTIEGIHFAPFTKRQ